MRILHTVRRYCPEMGGSEEVVRKLSEFLVSKGHDVTVATSPSAKRSSASINGVSIAEFACSGNLVEGIKGEKEEYVDFVERNNFDVIMNYSAHVWTTDLLFPHLRTLRAKKILVPLNYYPINNPAYSDYFRRLPEILQSYERIIYLSARGRDKEFGDRAGLRNGMIIPNGADLGEFNAQRKGEFRKRHGLEGKVILLNVSNHSNLKNHRFFWNVVRQFKNPDIAAVLVGNPFHPFPFKWGSECYARCRLEGLLQNSLVLENLPRHEVVQAFLDADIFVFGSKAEASPLVMVESFLSKTLFVSTEIGNVRDYDDIACVVGDEKEAYERIMEYRLNPNQFSDQLEKGYRHVKDDLNWNAIGEQYEKLYLTLHDIGYGKKTAQ